jgi:tRNA 2-selenouridine synthase
LGTISAHAAMRLQKAGKLALLDVRSEGEFGHGHILGSENAPILKNEERHLVGLTYKQVGQDAAIRLGHELVDPVRPERVAAWSEYLRTQGTPLVACWRGGLRSGLAQSWLKEAGTAALRVEGGYKALRAVLLAELGKARRGVVITGNTGSGKTDFLSSLERPQAIDLEALAGHRGSSFGGLFRAPQPAQQTFENAIAQKLFGLSEDAPLVLEDESRLVGRCVIPDVFYGKMMHFPRAELVTPFARRVENIRREYVDEPLRSMEAEDVHRRLEAALLTLKNRLGGADTKELQELLRAAFRGEASHEAWIEKLLERYYDPLYAHSMARRKSEVVFRGDERALRDWLSSAGYL